MNILLKRYNGDLRKAFPAYNAGKYKPAKGTTAKKLFKMGIPVASNTGYQDNIIAAYIYLRNKAGKDDSLVVQGYS